MQTQKALKDELHQTKSDIMTQNPGMSNVWHKDGGFPKGHFQKKMEVAYYLMHRSVDRSFTFSDERSE